MLDAVVWLRDALGKSGDVEALQHYYFDNRTIRASNNEIIACYPCETELVGTLPGKPFEVALKDAPKDVVLLSDGTLRASKYHARLPQGNFPVEGDTERPQTVPCDQDILLCAHALLPFIDPDEVRPFMRGTLVWREHLFAVRGPMVVATREPVAKGLGEGVVPQAIIRFAAKRIDGLIGINLTKQALFLEWNNGAWAKSRMIDYDDVPETLWNFFLTANADDADWHPIPEALFVAARQAMKLDAPVLSLSRKKIEISSPHGMIEHETELSLPKPLAINPALIEPLEGLMTEACFDEHHFRMRGDRFCAIGCYMYLSQGDGGNDEPV